jgi:uncharacterized protein (TIGR00369 family)
VDPISAGFDQVAVNRTFGFERIRSGSEGAEIRLRPGAGLAQEYGVIHGGVIAALADTAAVYCVLPALPAGERMTSIEFKLNFTAAAMPDAAPLVATAHPAKVGRSVAVVRVDVRQGATLVATGLFTYLRLRGAGG